MKGSEKEFIAESEEILQEAGSLLLEIQDTYTEGLNPDTLNALFRSIHTLKGLSGLFGHSSITEISHALESVLDDIRLGKVEIDNKVIDFLFHSTDILKGAVEQLKDGLDADVSSYIAEIKAFKDSLKNKSQADKLEGIIDNSILRVLSEYEDHRLRTNVKENNGIYLVKTVFPISSFEKSLQAVTKSIKSVGELISTLPTSLDMPPDSIGFNLLLGSSVDGEEIKKTVGYDYIELLAPKVFRQAPAQSMKETSLKAGSTTVRVDIEKLDRILNTIGELTLAKGAVKRIGDELAVLLGHSPLVIEVYKLSQTLERRIAELQGQVLEIRMVPIGQIFARLSQVIRRYSKEVDKDIELLMYGEETEIDKYLAEEIIDPLVHTVRNAIDHGIESKEERQKKGKRDVGTVMLKAFQRGNHVVVEVRDDGKGIDLNKVKEKAVKKGLFEEGVEVSRRELMELIFMPGFSTKDTVSEVSGRGVGLDIVKDKVSTLGGFADVETEAGEGTTFTLTLPITLAIIKALLVRVGGIRFAVPLTSISETLVIEHSTLQTIEAREVYNLRGDMLPMTRLKDVFSIPGDASERSFVVIVGFGERRIGLLVDELLGQHEMVIKSLGDYLSDLKGFAGAAEVGNNEIILVLDVEAVIEESTLKQRGVINV